jgi:transcriptional regulator with GAF, ATPase, and Fis domain
VILTRSSSLAISAPESASSGGNLIPARINNFDERDMIVRILKETKGRVGGPNGAAARMGLKRTTLLTRLNKMGIDPRKMLSVF